MKEIAFQAFTNILGESLIKAPIVKVGRWQSTDVARIDAMDTPELINKSISIGIPQSIEDLQVVVSPNLPWAENQFQERVSGKPLNPGKTFQEWPWYKGEAHRKGERFSHTYMERMWPKMANNGRMYGGGYDEETHLGIRYQYGDLNDVVSLLAREPYTRQAYLPIWNHEDTGVVHGERVPCSLGYQFLFREGKLNITYHIRSCDFVRHFADDVYMAARLCQWMIQAVKDKLWEGEDPVPSTWDFAVPNILIMHIGSLHCFRGDLPRLEREYGSN